MIITEKKYEEADYKELVRELLVAPDLDAEFQFRHFKSVLNSNRRFFLLLFKALDEIKSRAILFDDETLHNAINRLEGKLYEYTNVIPAKIPESILSDRLLIDQYLADQPRIHFQKEDWQQFQYYVKDKLNTIPQKQRLPFLEWCLKMMQMNAERHKKRCTNPTNCGIDQGYDLRIQFIETMIEEITPIQAETIPIGPAIQSVLQDSGLRLSSRKGAKIDLIRIVNAMWELGLFRDQDDLKPNKLTVMKAVGTLFGIDLSNYDKDLSQAFQTTNTENNIKIFKELEEITKNKLI
ncbi:MAG TPA: hypothetical protein PLM41_15785 [Saprospiraceae bacterium]|nr:hypothetical protein [Saprospiraceae bacterium]HPI07851.1 hypothetical protein [Saprospiraceae bacterium]